MSAAKYTYRVSHDEYGTAAVVAKDEAEAGQKAAEKWRVLWREIAGWCDIQRGTAAKEARCAGCGGAYYGRPGGLCIDCMRKRDMRRATMPKFKRKDRRF